MRAPEIALFSTNDIILRAWGERAGQKRPKKLRAHLGMPPVAIVARCRVREEYKRSYILISRSSSTIFYFHLRAQFQSKLRKKSHEELSRSVMGCAMFHKAMIMELVLLHVVEMYQITQVSIFFS